MGKDCVKCDEFQRDRQGRECRYCSWRNVTAPQPPADAATESRPVQRRKAAQKSEPAPTFAAGPPVTGDGDASLDADVREILARRGLPDSLFPVGLNDRIASAVREGLARGRALGARDAFEEAAKAAERWGNDDAADSIREIARRAGRVTK